MCKVEVNKLETTSNLKFEDIFVGEEQAYESPIDRFYTICTEYVKLTQPEIINVCSDLTRLLLMGYVSAVEEYLRNIICDVINIYDYAKELVSEKPIKFGAIDIYDRDRLAVGLFDSASFASEKEIKSRTKDFLGIEIKQGSSLDTALKNFNKICHLRHCSIHSGGILNAHNAKELELGRSTVGKKLNPDASQLQQIMAICYSFVRAYNQHVFECIVLKWKSNHEIKGIWNDDKDKITKLLNIFISKIDISEVNIEKIYKKMIIPPKVEDIAPSEKRNHKVIKSIIDNFIQEKDISKIPKELDKLTSDEYESLIKQFIYIDYQLTKKLILHMFNKSDSNTKKIISIYEFIDYKIKNTQFEGKEDNNCEIDGQVIEMSQIDAYFDTINREKVFRILSYFGILNKLSNKVQTDFPNDKFSIGSLEGKCGKGQIRIYVEIYKEDGNDVQSILYKLNDNYDWIKE